jgi:CO/xanthine dehydrogenase Mo-binding subunit
MASDWDTIGRPVRRNDGPAKVTGAMVYTADVKLPGLLVGRCLRSPYAHARIVSIVLEAARSVPGVHAVLCGTDLPDVRVGRDTRDMPILARDRVWFDGMKVAAVAAEDLAAADEALARIEVEYEELPAILDPEAALSEDAPVIHPDFTTFDGIVADAPRSHQNVVAERTWSRGDVEAGFARADHVFEHRFTTQHQHQGYMEPHACTARVCDDGSADVWACSKMPFQLRRQIARAAGLDEARVRLHAVAIGGDFGGKGGFMDAHVAYHLARVARRPVRIVMSYAEELAAANPRHAAVMTFRTGVRTDGTIVARHADLTFDSGGSAAFRPVRGIGYGARCLGPYRMDHARIDARFVYTNRVPCGSMRSPGDPQSIFAGESQIDLIARALGQDPYAFRVRSLVRAGDVAPLGQRYAAPLAIRTLEAAALASGYREPRKARAGVRIGRGMAICERTDGTGRAIVRIEIGADGEIRLATALRDTGVGLYTVLCQVAGRELGVPPESIRIVPLGTDAQEPDSGVGGARVTNAAGNAAREAAVGARVKLVAAAAACAGVAEIEVSLEGGAARIAGCAPLTFADLVAASAEPIAAEHCHDAVAGDDSVFAAQVAEVEIDVETGEVSLVRFTTAHDVGEILNPIAHQGQIEGGLMQGIGQALMEELLYADGRIVTRSLGDYKMPAAPDIPELTTVLVRSESGGPGPYGGKAIGEQSISSVAPAIHNAVLDAIGVSIPDLPITAEKVYRALTPRD